MHKDSTKKREDQKEDLETIQKSIEEAAKKVEHTTKSEREKEAKRTQRKSELEKRRQQGCVKVIRRMVLKKTRNHCHKQPSML